MVPILLPSTPYTLVPSTLSLPISAAVSLSIVAMEFSCLKSCRDNAPLSCSVPVGVLRRHQPIQKNEDLGPEGASHGTSDWRDGKSDSKRLRDEREASLP